MGRSNWPAAGRHSERKAPDLSKAERDKVLRIHPTCWLKIPGYCTTTSEQVHHRVDVEDGGTNDPHNLVGVCEPCHTRISAQNSQRRSVESANEWKRQPERRPEHLR